MTLAGPLALGLGVLLVICGATASTMLLRPGSRVDWAVTWAVTASAGVAAAVLICGIAGLLRAAGVLSLLAAWAAVAELVAWRSGRVALPHIADLHAGRLAPWSSALAVMAGLALAWQVLVALVLPQYAYDALNYHLTAVATWIQQGNVAPPELSRCCAYYPLTPELLIVFPALLLGNDHLVGLVQIPFVMLGAAATVGLGRSAGLSRSAAVAAGALFAMTPAVLTQAPTNYVDVTMSALVLASLHAIVRYSASGSGQQMLVAGLAAGLVVGTKGIGLLWGFALLLTAAVATLMAVRHDRVSLASAVKALTGAACAGAALGGWWYVRNAWITGNPLYPFAIHAFGHTIFQGPSEIGERLSIPPFGGHAAWLIAVVLNWARDLKFWAHGSYYYGQTAGGLGPLWAWLGVPLTAATLLVLFRRQSPTLLAVGAVLLVFIVQPYAWWARFTLPLAALGAISVGLAATSAPWPWFRAIVRWTASMLALAGVMLSTYAVDPASGARDLPASRVLGLIGESREQRSLGRLFHPEYAFLDSVPEDATVVVDTDAQTRLFVSPLFGPRFSRRVMAFDRGSPTADAWLLTSAGRPLDRTASSTHVLVSDMRGLRAWRPANRRR